MRNNKNKLQNICVEIVLIIIIISIMGVIKTNASIQSSSSTHSPLVKNDTMIINAQSNSWLRINTSLSPSTRANTAMAYDSKNDRIILFGGLTRDKQNNETWAYDSYNNSWMNMNPKNSPSARENHAMSYDTESDRIILFGGYDSSSSLLNDTWGYDYYTNNWTNMNPAVRPPAFRFSALIYDYKSDRSILFGGDFSYQVGTWAYDYNTNTWKNMNPFKIPSGRIAPAMSYDSDNDRIILFGGTGGSSMLNDTWSYDYKHNMWNHLGPSNSPPPRHSHTLVYNNKSDIVFLFGGWDSIDRINDTWAYYLEGSPPSDIYPPYVITTTPKNNSKDTPITIEILIRWNEGMYQNSTEKAFRATPSIKCKWYWMGMYQICNPLHELFHNTSYHIEISIDAKDIALNPMKSNYSFSFTTIRDSTAPYVVLTHPPDKATYVENTMKITLTFNEPMNRTTTENAISISSSSITNIQWNNDSTTVILTAALGEGKTYTIRVSKNATDLSGNKMMSDYFLTFTTKPLLWFDIYFLLSIIIIIFIPIAIIFTYRKMRKKE